MCGQEIQQMMYVAGETQEAPPATIELMEEIVKEQVVEMVSRAVALANRRGSRTLSNEDFLFLFRHDKDKVYRLRHFLLWKDIRKNMKDNGEKAGPSTALEISTGDVHGQEETAAQNTEEGGEDVVKVLKRKLPPLPWDIESFFSEQVPELRNDNENSEEAEMKQQALQRLRQVDERTNAMSNQEYAFWAECRHASFTRRRTKAFRQWASLDSILNGKPTDDTIDILGYLTTNMVQKLTEEAMQIRDKENIVVVMKRNLEKESGAVADIFSLSQDSQPPIMPHHIREAFRKIQIPSMRDRAFSGLAMGTAPKKPRLKLF